VIEHLAQPKIGDIAEQIRADGVLKDAMKFEGSYDKEKLRTIMRLKGFKTLKEALVWAVDEAARAVVIANVKATPWTAEMLKDAIEPGYDIIALRHGKRT
jgi:hypothetical protein